MSSLHARVTDPDRGIDAELAVEAETVTAILGPNGAGKSTLLTTIAGLHHPPVAHIELGGRNLEGIPPHRRRVALLAQQPLLFPHMTVLENVAFAPRSAGASRSESRTIAAQWLEEVEATELAARKPHQISGGQAQRIAVARALAAGPELLLLDEPMAALDVAAAPALRSLLRRVLREAGETAILVTHDPLDALGLADRAIIVDNGRIVEDGSVHTVLSHPRSSFGARIAGVNICFGRVVEPGCLRTVTGQHVHGIAAEPLPTGSNAVAIFSPTAVAVYAQAPHGSPRNHFTVTVSGQEHRGSLIRITGQDSDEQPGLMADITPAAAAELDLAPGAEVQLVVKATETRIYPA
ncbi:ATP-binding cassette domain-containing protein [Hoyosella sp. G463]|uniref:ATP-binding cassette domain-containing protein n=1 Tax=Lolliginicoccus lacisalsi TaxID=2742202 RepID=A0A927PLP6_9ACTN|nr:ATP-binding cassette domain-containing protein [Lolliginicoccus lacisalsi]MBD8505596.1 ATP-binding cassette domain-containing protein [Lolliginicoccus lacisalsi]